MIWKVKFWDCLNELYGGRFYIDYNIEVFVIGLFCFLFIDFRFYCVIKYFFIILDGNVEYCGCDCICYLGRIYYLNFFDIKIIFYDIVWILKNYIILILIIFL